MCLYDNMQNNVSPNMMIYHDRAGLDSIRPGISGPIGCPQVDVRLRQSTPNQKSRYDIDFSGNSTARVGSNIADGHRPSFLTGATHGNVIQDYFRTNQSSRNFVSSHVPGNNVTPTGGREQSVWNRQWANKVNDVMEKLKPVPIVGGEPFALRGTPRGVALPRITGQSSGEDSMEVAVNPFEQFVNAVVGRGQTGPPGKQ
jgi:hypothetical protein